MTRRRTPEEIRSFERDLLRRTRGRLPYLRFFRFSRDELESVDYDVRPWRRWQVVSYIVFGFLLIGAGFLSAAAMAAGKDGGKAGPPGVVALLLGGLACFRLALRAR